MSEQGETPRRGGNINVPAVVNGRRVFLTPRNTFLYCFTQGHGDFNYGFYQDEYGEKEPFLPEPEIRETLEWQGFPGCWLDRLDPDSIDLFMDLAKEKFHQTLENLKPPLTPDQP